MRTSLLARVIATALVFTVAAPAHAGGLPGPMDGESSRGKSYSRDVRSLFTTSWRSRCTLDDVAKWKADIAYWRAKAAALDEPADRTNFDYYFNEVEKWQAEEAKGIKGVGTWAELTRKFVDAQAAAGNPAEDPEMITDTAQFEVGMARSISIKDAHATLAALQKTVEEASTCAGRVGDFQKALRSLEDRRRSVGAALMERYNKASAEIYGASATPLSTDRPTTWAEARDQLMRGLQLLELLQSAPRGYAAYVHYGQFAGMSSGSISAFREADEVLARHRTTLPGQLESLLGMMTLPPRVGANAKIAAFMKQVLARVQANGKVLRSAAVTRTRVVDYKEVDRVDGRTHAVTEETAMFYFAQKPNTLALPALPTLRAEDICQIHSVSAHLYRKAGPSHTLKRWNVAQEGLSALMLCKNASKASSFKE